VLKLLRSNVGERFIVTEYHECGTLDKHLNCYRGDALAALQAFGKLVDGVLEIHKLGAIHRDIKPENIFVTASGDLVLGDFGIVFFEAGERLTKTYGERVGSHYWMAPWAYDNVRLELSQMGYLLDSGNPKM
jgi:serine/threonine protein kinase